MTSLLRSAPARLRALVVGEVALPALVRRIVEATEKRAAGSVAEPRASGVLRASVASAWEMGRYPKPKTTAPDREGQPARTMATAKPPANRAFNEDMMKSLADPARGARVSLPPQ